MAKPNKQKHGSRWSCDEVEALLTEIEKHSNPVLGSFSLGCYSRITKKCMGKDRNNGEFYANGFAFGYGFLYSYSILFYSFKLS